MEIIAAQNVIETIECYSGVVRLKRDIRLVGHHLLVFLFDGMFSHLPPVDECALETLFPSIHADQ